MYPLPIPVPLNVSMDGHSDDRHQHRPLQVYHRRQHPPMLPPVEQFSTTAADPTILDSTTSKLDMPIALRKGKRSSTAHPISNFMSYDKLHPAFHSFALSIYSESISKNYQKIIQIPHWKAAMDDEMEVLQSRGTWELVTCSVGASIVTCRWVFTVKYKPDGSVDRYKARLVARGFSQTYRVDYAETFSLVARLNSIRVLLSVVINQSWELFQLDIKNTFLYDDLTEQVLMEQPPGYIAQEENRVCMLKKTIYGLKQSPRA